VTCSAHLEYYPVGGPHNGGWDSNATTFTCDPHPGSLPDNSDWIPGDHFGNDLFAQEGTPAIAVVSGTIYNSGYSGIGGNRVTIEDSCGWLRQRRPVHER
jgi:murein DD-endopeptidase MepM/ murein hydrolase activator NlpD